MTIRNALVQWTQFGGDVGKLLRGCGSRELVCTEDVHALADALRRFRDGEIHGVVGERSLFELCVLFQYIENDEVLKEAKRIAFPELKVFIQDAISGRSWGDDGEMMALKIVAMHGDVSDVSVLTAAVEAPLHEEHRMWEIVVRFLQQEKGLEFLKQLGSDIPLSFIGVCILDCANNLCLSGEVIEHPYNTDNGAERLKSFLESKDAKYFSCAGSAVMAIPFLDKSRQSELLGLARQHQEFRVQVGGAWAGAKLGHKDSIDRLAEFAAEVKSTYIACRFLTHLGFEERIPAITENPEFAAKAELASWLSHPNELGCYPDSIDVLDNRRLFWPPTNDERDVWLLRYQADVNGEKASGIGMVGSITFVLFGVTDSLCVEDVYVEHCAWELGQQNPGILERIRNDNRPRARQLLAAQNEGF